MSSLAFAPDGRDIVGGGDARTTRLWHVPTGQQRWKLPRKTPYTSLAFSPDGELLATAPGDQRLAFSAHTGPVFTMPFSPDSHTLAAGGLDRVIRLWDVRIE